MSFGSPGRQAVIKCTPDLTSLLKHNLSCSDKLLGTGFITENVHNWVLTASGVSNSEKAARLVSCIADRVHGSSRFNSFIAVLKEKDPFCTDIVEKLTSLYNSFSAITSNEERQKGQAITKRAQVKVKADFSSLLLDVQSSIEGHNIPVKEVRRFLVGFFESDCSIPKGGDVDDIFDAITGARLWTYDHYEPLEQLAVKFLQEDDPARVKLTEYKSQLSAFQTTTKIIDFINHYELEDREEIPHCIFSPKKYNSHYERLTVKLRHERYISEVTLEYVHNLCKKLAEEFHLPPLTAVIDKIVKDSMKITWLPLPRIIERIRATYFKSIKFFQQRNIISIDLYAYGNSDGKGNGWLNLYDEEYMVTTSTALFRASFTGDIDEVKNLLEGGAKVDEENNNDLGFTPLMGACITGQVDIARLLLRHRAGVNYQAKRRVSALMVASKYNHPSTALVLLEHGAKVDVSDDESGDMALELAQCQGCQDICDILLRYSRQSPKIIPPTELCCFSVASLETTNIEPQVLTAEVDSHSPSEDTQQKRTESEKEKEGENCKPNSELNEVQTAKKRAVREQLWKQFRKIFLSELVKKEEAATMRRESEHKKKLASQRRGFISGLFPRRGQRTPRGGSRPVVETVPAPER